MPTVDPYSFTAPGADWVVQSWLASWIYAWVEKLAGGDGLRALMGVLCAGLAALTWRLSRPAQGLLVRFAIGATVVAIGASLWSPRPLLFGLIGLGLTVLAVEGGLEPRWLLPVGWLWANTHGSFPLGVAYLVVVLVGQRLDRDVREAPGRALRWLVGGILLAAVNPIGPRLLLFPLELLGKQEVLQHVTEWQAPTFRSLAERLFLLQLVVVVLALVRRPRWSDAAVVVVFGAAALVGSRNITVASITFIPVLARAWPEVGSLRAQARNLIAVALAGVALVAGVAAGVARLREPTFDLKGYPIAALATLESSGIDLREVRLVTTERVGNLIEVVHGPGERVFYDDRFDMYPAEVSEDALTLFHARPRARTVLDDHDAELVLWQRSSPLTAVLVADGRWRTLEQDDGWVLLCRRTSLIGGTVGRC